MKKTTTHPTTQAEQLSYRTEIRLTEEQHQWLLNQKPMGLAQQVRALVDEAMEIESGDSHE
ncbi:hypothetical protein V7985_004849 [Vibrio parahaemolyticus]